jgi:hypothetical protein
VHRAANGAVGSDAIDDDGDAVARSGGGGFKMDGEVALAAAVVEGVEIVLLFDEKFDLFAEELLAEIVAVR